MSKTYTIKPFTLEGFRAVMKQVMEAGLQAEPTLCFRCNRPFDGRLPRNHALVKAFCALCLAEPDIEDFQRAVAYLNGVKNEDR